MKIPRDSIHPVSITSIDACSTGVCHRFLATIFLVPLEQPRFKDKMLSMGVGVEFQELICSRVRFEGDYLLEILSEVKRVSSNVRPDV